MKDHDESLQQLWMRVQDIPRPNYALLKFLFRFLHQVSLYESVNKMTASNLAICFGPNVLRRKQNQQMVCIYCIVSMMADVDVGG